MHFSYIITSSILLASACAEHFPIPQVQSAVSSALAKYSKYVHYHGPTGTAAAAIASATGKAHEHHDLANVDPPYWLADIAHQGFAPYAGSGYQVFRNVKDYGAVGELVNVWLIGLSFKWMSGT